MDRASKDQQRQFLQSLKDSGRLDLLLSELQEAPSGSLASMHDGAKRHMFSPSSEEFDLIEAPALAAEFGVSAQSTPCQSPVVPKSSRAAPGGGGSKKAPPMKVWERTLCELPKYKSKNWCYSEMVAIANFGSSSPLLSGLGYPEWPRFQQSPGLWRLPDGHWLDWETWRWGVLLPWHLRCPSLEVRMTLTISLLVTMSAEEGISFFLIGTLYRECELGAFMLHWQFLMSVTSAADLLWCKRAVMLPQVGLLLLCH